MIGLLLAASVAYAPSPEALQAASNLAALRQASDLVRPGILLKKPQYVGPGIYTNVPDLVLPWVRKADPKEIARWNKQKPIYHVWVTREEFYQDRIANALEDIAQDFSDDRFDQEYRDDGRYEEPD